MKEYIEKDALAEDGWYLQRHISGNGYARIESMNILDIPAADVRPVVRGKWLESNNGPMQKCSVCGATGWDVFYFCPNCGARMDGGVDK